MPVPGLPAGGLSFKGGDSRSATNGQSSTGGINFAANETDWLMVVAVSGAVLIAAAVIIKGK